MSSLTLEHVVIQNPVLGASALWSFCKEYVEYGGEAGASLPKVMLVLPIVLHKQSAQYIRRIQRKSGLIKALAEHPDLVLNLQERLERFSTLTLTSLELACLSSLLVVDRTREWPLYLPQRKTMPTALLPVADDVKAIISASKRLGAWFSQVEVASLSKLLQVQY